MIACGATVSLVNGLLCLLCVCERVCRGCVICHHNHHHQRNTEITDCRPPTSTIAYAHTLTHSVGTSSQASNAVNRKRITYNGAR